MYCKLQFLFYKLIKKLFDNNLSIRSLFTTDSESKYNYNYKTFPTLPSIYKC